jgi:hypothetical protein
VDEQTRDVLTETLIREAAGLAVILGVLWVMGPGKVWLEAVACKARSLRRRDPHEGMIRQFAAEVSRWDHEQASGQDRPAAPGGGCGCGG